MQIHGLKYDTEASVQVNNSAWLPISTANVTLLGNAAAFGGIGGGFHTLEMTLNLPAGVVTTGTNTIAFRFNQTDGITSGYRVLEFNIQSGGSNLLSSSLFVWDDPNTWQPPSTAASDIAAGLSLYQGAQLTVPVSGGTQTIHAHCSDCHSVDGRDLKYFNYSNGSIVARSVFHGLTWQQGNQIASYIRSLNLPNPGRPWNPPYQPGVGTDSQPVENWAAGAGLGAVLDNDSEMLQYMAPGGSTAGWAANDYLNAREIPVTMQLPDWNSWLPIVHPMDAFGSTFTSSPLATEFTTLHNQFATTSNLAQTYGGAPAGSFNRLYLDELSFGGAINASGVTSWTPALRQNYYSYGLWIMVKTWEFNQDFGLEAIPQALFGAKADVRGWYGSMAFDASPNMKHVPYGPGLGNGTQVFADYMSLAWYQVQLVLNDGQGTQDDHNPIDYGYVGGFISNVFASESKLPGGMLQMQYLVKGLQEWTLSGKNPSTGVGFNAAQTSPFLLVVFNNFPEWNGYSPSTIATLFTAYTQAWFNQVSQYTPAEFYAGGWASATENPQTDRYTGPFGGELWYTLPRLRFEGVPASLTTQISNWAARIWPLGNWTLNNAATCSSLAGNSGACTSGGVSIF